MLLAQRNVHAREIELSSLHTDLNQSEAELQRLDDLLHDETEPNNITSWFVNDPSGLQLARAPEGGCCSVR